MSNLNKWIESHPFTEDTLQKLGQINMPDTDKDSKFQADLIRGHVLEYVLKRMGELNLSRANLAELMNCGQQYVDYILDDEYITIKTIAELSIALDCKIKISFKQK